jgi:hypothetical protein
MKKWGICEPDYRTTFNGAFGSAAKIKGFGFAPKTGRVF